MIVIAIVRDPVHLVQLIEFPMRGIREYCARCILVGKREEVGEGGSKKRISALELIYHGGLTGLKNVWVGFSAKGRTL